MTAAIASIVMLVLAIIGGWPYRYYQLLRTVVCFTVLFLASLGWRQSKDNWTWTFLIMALVFNPFVPLYLGRETWLLVDLVSLVLFSIAIGKLNVRRWRTLPRRRS